MRACDRRRPAPGIPFVHMIEPAGARAARQFRRAAHAQSSMRTRSTRAGIASASSRLRSSVSTCVIAGKLVYLGLQPDTQTPATARRPKPCRRRGPTSSTATAKSSRRTSRPCRSSPNRAASSTRMKPSNFSPPCCRTSTHATCASGSARARASSGSSATITPKQQQEVFRLGLPGIGFMPENKRVYPNGPSPSHVLGFTNLDNQGIAGHREIHRQPGPRRSQPRRLPADGRDDLKPIATVARPQRHARRARRTREGHREVQGQVRRRPPSWT